MKKKVQIAILAVFICAAGFVFYESGNIPADIGRIQGVLDVAQKERLSVQFHPGNIMVKAPGTGKMRIIDVPTLKKAVYENSGVIRLQFESLFFSDEKVVRGGVLE